MARSESLSSGRIEIIDFSPAHAADFRRLNEEWLTKYFRVEDIDAEMLGNPQRFIIEPGGDILFARKNSEIIGTVALKRLHADRYELTKMAVTESARNGGVGKRLLAAAIRRYKRRSGRLLCLESHSSLQAAITLYERAGFRHSSRDVDSKYERADVYMVYRDL